MAPRSIVVFAPISTSSPIWTLPTCGTFTQVPASGAKPKPSAPTTAPACRMQRRPMRTAAQTLTRDIRRAPEAHWGTEVAPRQKARAGSDMRAPLHDASGTHEYLLADVGTVLDDAQ